ncbi:MAG: hypothetical protein HQ463_05555 [Bacteroidetes bacterium]|nr:hypothetical protein [Bacteroidota bacterium]
MVLGEPIIDNLKTKDIDLSISQICGQLSSGGLFENPIANQLCCVGEVNFYEKS